MHQCTLYTVQWNQASELWPPLYNSHMSQLHTHVYKLTPEMWPPQLLGQ